MSKTTLTVGFAVFAMFFGAGNMVLPLVLAQKYHDYWLSSFLGFCITAVIITLFGLIAAVLSGNIKNFFAPLGVVGAMVMQIILICIEGPFGVVPRSMIVSLGSVKSVFPDINKIYYYIASYIVLYFLATNKTKIVPIIGKILTPVMLLFLVILVYYASNSVHEVTYPEIQFSMISFYEGLVAGYLTYDLPGAIYFTSIAIGYLKSIGANENERLSNGVKSALVSAFLLVIVYAIFIYLGLNYAYIIKDASPEMMLPTIVKGVLGFSAEYVFVSFVFLACITTAVAAISIWTDFIIYILPDKYANSEKIILIFSLIIAFSVSMLDFNGLMKLIAPLLEVIYPILIILTFYNIYIHSRNLYR